MAAEPAATVVSKIKTTVLIGTARAPTIGLLIPIPRITSVIVTGAPVTTPTTALVTLIVVTAVTVIKGIAIRTTATAATTVHPAMVMTIFASHGDGPPNGVGVTTSGGAGGGGIHEAPAAATTTSHPFAVTTSRPAPLTILLSRVRRIDRAAPIPHLVIALLLLPTMPIDDNCITAHDGSSLLYPGAKPNFSSGSGSFVGGRARCSGGPRETRHFRVRSPPLPPVAVVGAA